MSSPFPSPDEAKKSGQECPIAKAARLKQRLMQQRRRPTESEQPEDMSSSQDAPGQLQQQVQQEQPTSDGLGPTQTETITAAGAQFIPGLSYQPPDDRGTHDDALHLKEPSALNSPDQPNANDSVKTCTAITEKLMDKISSSTQSKTAGKDTNDALRAVSEVRREINAPSAANNHAAAKVQEKRADGARSKVHRGDDSADTKATHASLSSNKSSSAPKRRSNTQSSIEDGEITSKPSAPRRKIPVQEPPLQPASPKKTTPARASAVASVAPAEPRAERPLPRSLEATPASKCRGNKGEAAPVHSSASRFVSKHETGRTSLSARPGKPGHDSRTTWETYKEPPPPPAHPMYARTSREQRPRSVSPVASWPTQGSDWEVQRFASQHPDLRDWLELTGWNNPEFRTRHLGRLRRLNEIQRESDELKRQGEREKARLSEFGEPTGRASRLSDSGPQPQPQPPAPPRQANDFEPAEHRMIGRYAGTAGIKRERGEDSDSDGDGGFSAKYHRTGRNHRGSRAGYHGSHRSHHRGRQDPRHWQDRGNQTCLPPVSFLLSQYHRSPKGLPTDCLHILYKVASILRDLRTTLAPHVRKHSFVPLLTCSAPDRPRSGRLSPPRALLETPAPRPVPKYNPRQRFPNPAGHSLPRDDFNAEHAIDRYVTRDQPPRRCRSPRSSSPPPHGRGYKPTRFHRSEYGRP